MGYFSGGGPCCWKVAIQHSTDTTKAYVKHPYLYQTYYQKPGYENGGVYYVSADDKYAIWRDGSGTSGDWIVGIKSEL